MDFLGDMNSPQFCPTSQSRGTKSSCSSDLHCSTSQSDPEVLFSTFLSWMRSDLLATLLEELAGKAAGLESEGHESGALSLSESTHRRGLCSESEPPSAISNATSSSGRTSSISDAKGMRGMSRTTCT